MKNCSGNNGTTGYSALKWRVPVYIFGAVGAMLLIIFFASLILVCSFWNLSRRNNSELSDCIDHSIQPCSAIDYKEEAEKVVVMMPGDEQPTFIAQPTSVTEGLICKV